MTDDSNVATDAVEQPPTTCNWNGCNDEREDGARLCTFHLLMASTIPDEGTFRSEFLP